MNSTNKPYYGHVQEKECKHTIQKLSYNVVNMTKGWAHVAKQFEHELHVVVHLDLDNSSDRSVKNQVIVEQFIM